VGVVVEQDAKIKVYLRFWGIFDPHEITGLLGIEPTESFSHGDTYGKSISKVSSWSLYSRLPESAPLQKHIHDVLEQIHPHKERILALTEQYEGYLDCVIYNYSAQAPSMWFEPSVLRECVSMGLGIDIDFYCLAEVETTH
jgi:hypothetical protein